MISDACMFLVRDKTSHLISTAFLKLHFQSAWQHPAINTLSSLSWHWFYSPEEGERVWWRGRERERERERGRGGGRWKYCCHVSAPPCSGNVQPDVPYILTLPYTQSHMTRQKNRHGGISVRDKHWIITAIIPSLTHYGCSPRDFFSPLW